MNEFPDTSPADIPPKDQQDTTPSETGEQPVFDSPTYYVGGALKTAGDGRVGGYLVVFGDPQRRDSYGEYFTGQTDFGLDKYRNQPVLYHHSQNDARATSIGVIDTLKLDGYGLYAEAQLDINHEDPAIRRYARMAYDQVNAGQLFWSSGSAGHLVRNTDDGQITQWWIVEGSLTPKPAEQSGRTQVAALRAALDALIGALPSLENAAEALPPKEPAMAKETSLPQSVDASPAAPASSSSRVRSKRTPSPRKLMIGNKATKMSAVQILGALDNVADLDDATKLAIFREIANADMQEEVAEGEMPPIASDAPVDELPSAAPTLQSDTPEMTPPPPQPMMGRSVGISPKEFAEQLRQYMRSATAAPLPGGGGQSPHTPARGPRIEMRTKYHDLSAVDMAYMHEWRAGMAHTSRKSNLMPDTKFVRELLDKTQRELTYESGRKSMEMASDDANRILAIRSNELDNTQAAGQVLEWIPTIWSAELWRRVRVDNEVARSFRTVEMPSQTYNLPIESTDPTVSYVPETTDRSQLTLSTTANPIPDSVVSSGKVTLTAKKLALRVGFSSETEEDSIIPFIPQLRAQGIRAMANAVDNVLLNGDTATGANTNINLIDGTPGGTAKYLIFNGLLKNALVTTSGQSVSLSGASPTLQNIRQLRAKLQSTLNVYGLRPDDLVMFVDPSTWFKMLSIDEINAWLNNGRNATVNDGLLPNIDGIPIWPSQELSLADATGKVSGTAANNAYGRIVMAAKQGWTIGYRRQITTNVDYLSYYDSYQFTATLRLAFINKDGYASASAYDIGVN